MNTSIRTWRAIQLTLAAAGSLLVSDLSLAQQTPEVTIEAVRPAKAVGRSYDATPIEVTKITRKVSFADLDLATKPGATELEKRVNDTAKAICKQLDKIYPNTVSESPACVKKAADGAMDQVRVAITAAASRGSAR